MSVDADSREGGASMNERGDFPPLGTGGVSKVTGEITFISSDDLAEVIDRLPDVSGADAADAFPDLGTGGVVKIIRVTGDFPVLKPGVVRKMFPDLHVGDTVKVSGGLLDAEVSQPVTIWSGKLDDAIAIAPADHDQGPPPNDEISATVSFVEGSAVYLSMRSDRNAGEAGL
jgi:hypothetical protein